jgi:hypothetical protein
MVSNEKVGKEARLRFSPVPSSASVFRSGKSRLGARIQKKKAPIMRWVRFISGKTSFIKWLNIR